MEGGDVRGRGVAVDGSFMANQIEVATLRPSRLCDDRFYLFFNDRFPLNRSSQYRRQVPITLSRFPVADYSSNRRARYTYDRSFRHASSSSPSLSLSLSSFFFLCVSRNVIRRSTGAIKRHGAVSQSEVSQRHVDCRSRINRKAVTIESMSNCRISGWLGRYKQTTRQKGAARK